MFKKINKTLIHVCLKYPKLVVSASILVTMLIISGSSYVRQDDNMVNLLPEDIGSRKVFSEIQDEYGLTEYMYVAVGNKNKNY